MKLYLAIEAMTLLNTYGSTACENLCSQVKVCKTFDDAVKSVRNFIQEQVKCEYEEDELYTDEDIDMEAKMVFDKTDGTLAGDEWHYEAYNRAATWRIEEVEV